MPHEGDWRAAGSCRAGLEFNNPLIVRKSSPHPGTLSDRWGLLDVSPSSVLLSALKLANDGAVVIRVYEAAGEPVTGAAITLHAKVLSAQEANLMEDSTAKSRSAKNTLQFDLHPFQIRTFKVRLAPLRTN